MSGRFVAGMTVEEAIAAAQQLNREGIAVTLDSLGESSPTSRMPTPPPPSTTVSSTRSPRRNLNANVSLKLSQMGMDFGGELAEGQASPNASSASSSSTPPASTTSSASTWKAPSTPKPPSP